MPDFETIRDAKADLVLAHLHFAILFDSINEAAVSTLEDAATGELDIPETAESAGIIEKQAGVSLTHDIESNDVEGYGEAEPVRTIISKRTVEFQANFLETNKVVLEKFWGTVFDDTNLDVSDHGGVTVKAPTLPKNTFYRAYLVATDDVDGDDIYAYYIMPRVKLVNVDNQESQDDNATSYQMTFRAFRDKVVGFAVLQGWCGPGWRKLVHKTGFVAAPTAITVTPDDPSIAEAGEQQLTVMGDNGINYTPDATFVSATPASATVDASGLVTGVSAGTSEVTATLTGFSDSPLSDSVTVTVTS